MYYNQDYYKNKDNGKPKPLKPVLTEYEGISYRSKTEAKVAILLDLLTIPHSYEKEGYYLHDGYTTYSPDFSIRDGSIEGVPDHFYIEVKGAKAPRQTDKPKDFVQYNKANKVGMTTSMLVLSDLPYGTKYYNFLYELAGLYDGAVKVIGDGSMYGNDLIEGVEKPGLALLAVNRDGQPQLYNLSEKIPYKNIDIPATLASYTIAATAKFDKDFKKMATVDNMMEQKETLQQNIERRGDYYGGKSMYYKAIEKARRFKQTLATA